MTSSPKLKTFLVREEKKRLKLGDVKEETQPFIPIKQRLLNDEEARVVISLVTNKKIGVDISEEELNLFMNQYFANPTSFFKEVEISILPVQRREFAWHSTASQRLRLKLRKKAKEVVETISSASQVLLDGFKVLADDTFRPVLKQDEFDDMEIYVERKPKKRNGERSGISAFNYRVHYNDSVYRVAGFVEVKNEKRKEEHKVADMLADELIELIIKNIPSYNEKVLGDALNEFVSRWNIRIRQEFNSVAGFALLVVSDGAVLYSAGNVEVGYVEGRAFKSLFKSETPMIGEMVQAVKSRGRIIYIDNPVRVQVKTIPLLPLYVLLSKGLVSRLKDNTKVNPKNIAKSLVKKARKLAPFRDDICCIVG